MVQVGIGGVNHLEKVLGSPEIAERDLCQA